MNPLTAFIQALPSTPSLDDQLQTLKGIHWPEAPGWLPQAPGFWLLGLGLTSALISGLWLWYSRRLTPLSQATKELTALYERLRDNPTNTQRLQFAEDCKILLKRIARQLYPNKKPDTLTHKDWRHFLLATSPGSNPPEALLDALYQPEPKVAPPELKLWMDNWLKRQSYRWL